MNATPADPEIPSRATSYILRERYLRRIEAFLNRPIVKILVGMRRVGKSVLLRLLIQRLVSQGVSPENILYINKESLEFDTLRTYEDLNRFVKSYFRHVTGPRYVILDEVQLIEGWEKAVVSLLSEGYADVTLSGSNGQLLSSDLATLLSGRYVEIPVYPLTFSEFLSFRKNPEDPEKEFQRYLRYGGLPGIHQLLLEDEAVFGYLGSIIHTVFYKDIVSRYRIRDVSVLDRVIAFVFDNIGNLTSEKGISDYFKNQRIKIPVDTVANYLHFLESSFLIDRVKRFDLQGKRQLEYYDKFYLNDIGLRHGFLGYRERDIDGILENLVYKELQGNPSPVPVGFFTETGGFHPCRARGLL